MSQFLLSCSENSVVCVSEILCRWFYFSLRYGSFCSAMPSTTLVYSEYCLTCAVYIREKLVQGMCKLLDRQVDTQNENKNSTIHTTLVKCASRIKIRKKSIAP